MKVTIGDDTILIKGIAGVSAADLANNPEAWIKIVLVRIRLNDTRKPLTVTRVS